MARTKEDVKGSRVVYSLEGTLLEVCSCGVLCPCWVGEDPDGGECFSFLSYHFDRGQIDGVDVSGLSIANVVHIPGNVFQGGWRLVMFVDANANDEQKNAILKLFTGELGGPIADLAALVGEVVAVESAPIVHEIEGAKGTLRIDGVLEAEMEPYTGPDGSATTLRESVFSTVPGSPAYVGKATRQSVSLPQYGMEWSHEGRNAIQADWKIEHTA
jgi:hypothetical protein